jgi:hypothetical protein
MNNKIKNSEYHPDWQNNRIKFIISKYGENFFSGKNILELAPFNGYIGEYFRNLGANVLSVEGRQSNIDQIKRDYPNLNVILVDLDTPEWTCGKFDIIINFGLLYHLEKYHAEHLINCIKNCELMFLESVIFNSFENEIFKVDRIGVDQSLTQIDGYPSQKFVEDIFDSLGIEQYKMYTDSSLNGGMHIYDWELNGNKIFHQAIRRFWIVKNS